MSEKELPGMPDKSAVAKLAEEYIELEEKAEEVSEKQFSIGEQILKMLEKSKKKSVVIQSREFSIKMFAAKKKLICKQI